MVTRVLGFDTSPGMLARAVRAVPGATFAEAAIDALPVHDTSADHVVITLALSHSRDVRPFFAEAARVLRPGGHLVISDTRGLYFGSSLYPIDEEDVDGNVGYMPNYRHATGDYLRAAIPNGFVVRACEEVLRPYLTVEPDEELAEPWDHAGPPDIWALRTWCPRPRTPPASGCRR